MTELEWSDLICLNQFKSCCCCILLFKSGDTKETSDPGQIRENYSSLNTTRWKPVQQQQQCDMQIPACARTFLTSNCVCRECLAQLAGGADQPAVRSHAAPGAGAGPGQTVCWDPSFYAQLWWTKGEGNLSWYNYSPQRLTFTGLKNQHLPWIAFWKAKLPLFSPCRWQIQLFRMTSATTGGL